MHSAFVVTEKDVEGKTDPEDSVGLASYGVDVSHYATVRFEGEVALPGGYSSELYRDEPNRGI